MEDLENSLIRRVIGNSEVEGLPEWTILLPYSDYFATLLTNLIGEERVQLRVQNCARTISKYISEVTVRWPLGSDLTSALRTTYVLTPCSTVQQDIAFSG